jgi:hypothetical protein
VGASSKFDRTLTQEVSQICEPSTAALDRRDLVNADGSADWQAVGDVPETGSPGEGAAGGRMIGSLARSECKSLNSCSVAGAAVVTIGHSQIANRPK